MTFHRLTDQLKKSRNTIVLASIIAIASGVVCYYFRGIIYPGPGDFNMALDFARALVTGNDPYNFIPTKVRIGVPLPVAFFGLPLLNFRSQTAAAIFFGISAFLLASGILAKGKRWQLLIFLCFPFFYAMLLAQWSPIITASWFLPVLAPLFVLIKPNIALPIAVNRLTKPGIVLAAIVLLISIVIYPTWLYRWLQMTGDYEYIIPLITLPLGPILILSGIFWYDPRARLLLGLSLVPIRAAYDLVPLWIIPSTKHQMILLVFASWIIPVISLRIAIMVQPIWVVPFLYIPTLALVITSNWRSLKTFKEIILFE